MKRTLLMLFMGTALVTNAQEDDDFFSDDTEETKTYERAFSSTRIINGHSAETLEAGELEFRIEHRFGDVAGENGGAQAMFGFDNSTDIRFAFEYGLTDKMMIGLGRNKGAGNPYRSLLDGLYKYRFLSQGENAPLSMAILGVAAYTYMTASEEITDVSYFPKAAHRFAYVTQLNISRTFDGKASLALMPTVVHRNYVASDDQNTLFAIGAAARVSVSKKLGINLEYYHVMDDPNLRPEAMNSLSIAFDYSTFGHNFKIDITNSRGFGEAQFVTGTVSDWAKGQFRLGFAITRSFALKG
jgi:hypothetical protein